MSPLRFRSIACMVALVACLLAAPSTALANYDDVAQDYPAQQQLTVSGRTLTAADIPEGTYVVPALTTSYMCKLYDPSQKPNDANASAKKKLEDKCLLTVSGGKMTATFYISKAYTALYFGTAAQAAQLTDEAGTDGSAYLFGTPAEGYEYHLFTIPVSTLNATFSMATYTGGQSFEAGLWYDRDVVISSNDELMKAVNGEQDDVSSSSSSERQDDSSASSSAASASESGSAADGDSASGAATGGEQASSSSSSSSSASSANGAAAGNAGGTAGGAGGSGGSGTAGGSGAAGSAGGAGAGGLVGKALSIVSADEEALAAEPVEVDMAEPAAEALPVLPVACACGIVAVAVAGSLWRSVGFRRELKGPMPEG